MENKYMNSTINEDILIVSDSADELNDLQRLLAVDFGNLLKTDKESEGLRFFSKHHPSLLILAFNEIEIAEHFYLTLYKHVSDIKEIHHKTLLLCKHNESDKAYNLCKAETFDDYVADRPLYDPFRLRLSVTQALNSRRQNKYLKSLNDRVERVTVGLQQFDQFISGHISTGDEHYKKIFRTFKGFNNKLTSELKQLESVFLDNASINSMPEAEKKVMVKQFDRFRVDIFQNESQNVVEQLNKSNDWLKDLDSNYKNNFKYLQKQDEVCPLNIMLVDDDEFYRDTILAMLEGEGIIVDGVETGKKALENLQEYQPALILLDYNMPGIDGIETLKHIKSNPDTRSIPVIMLTGTSERGVVNRSIVAGAVDFIVKPSDRNTILSKINELLRH
jgi:PleD family two-component response regulator